MSPHNICLRGATITFLTLIAQAGIRAEMQQEIRDRHPITVPFARNVCTLMTNFPTTRRPIVLSLLT